MNPWDHFKDPPVGGNKNLGQQGRAFRGGGANLGEFGPDEPMIGPPWPGPGYSGDINLNPQNNFGNQGGFGNQGFGTPRFGAQDFGIQRLGTQDLGNQGFGIQRLGTQDFGNQGFANQGFGNQGFGTQGFGPQGFPTQHFPPPNFPAQLLSPRTFPLQDFPPQTLPIQNLTPRGYPPQGLGFDLCKLDALLEAAAPGNDEKIYDIYSPSYSPGGNLQPVQTPFERHSFFNPNLSVLPGCLDSMGRSRGFELSDVLRINKASRGFVVGLLGKFSDRPADPVTLKINSLLEGPAMGESLIADFKQALEVSDFCAFSHVPEKTEEPANPPSLPDNATSPTTALANLGFLKQGLRNWVISTFQPTSTSCKIGDLSELIGQSSSTILSSSGSARFVDKDFGNDARSILGFEESPDTSRFRRLGVAWQSATEIFGGRSIIRTSFDPSDIVQGELADCYLMAALCSIALRPPRLERLFLVKQSENKGIFSVGICVNGLWEEVVLDDRFPCLTGSSTPVFARSESGELWAMILEKAWAKVHGGYLNAAKGLAREALRDFTGASAKSYFTGVEGDKLFEIAREAIENNFVLTAGTGSGRQGADQVDEEIGLVGGHAYAVLDVVVIGGTAGNERRIIGNSNRQANFEGGVVNYSPHGDSNPSSDLRLLCLRNPWGRVEWVGPWSRNSNLWTPSLRKILRPESLSPGAFYISFSDFVKYFTDLQVCYFRDGYKYSGVKTSSAKGGSVFFWLDLPQSGEYYISLNQKNKRFFPRSENYAYSSLTLLLGQSGQLGQAGKFIGSSIKADKENWIRMDVQEGRYFALVKTPWVGAVDEFSLSVFGPHKAEISQTATNRLALESMAKSLIESPQKLSHHPKTGLRFFFFDSRGGLGFLYTKNEGSRRLAVTAELVNSKNVRFAPPFEGLRPTFSLDPGEAQILFIEADSESYKAEARVISTPAPDPQIVEQSTRRGTKVPILNRGEDVGASVSVLKHPNGAFLSYQNNGSLALREKLQFSLENCFVKNSVGLYFELTLQPKERHSIEIVKDPSSNSFSARIEYRVSEFTQPNEQI